MQWQIAQYVRARAKVSDALHIDIVWSETQLKLQISPDEFRRQVLRFHEALRAVHGCHLDWRFDPAIDQVAHIVHLRQP
jgi:hypothetical protein